MTVVAAGLSASGIERVVQAHPDSASGGGDRRCQRVGFHAVGDHRPFAAAAYVGEDGRQVRGRAPAGGERLCHRQRAAWIVAPKDRQRGHLGSRLGEQPGALALAQHQHPMLPGRCRR